MGRVVHNGRQKHIILYECFQWLGTVNNMSEQLCTAAECFPAAGVTSIFAEVADIQQHFRRILLNLRQLFKKENIDLASFKNDALLLPASEKLKEIPLLHNSRRQIRDASSFEDVIGIFDSYWSYLDYRLLEIIVKMLRNGKLCQSMQYYSEKVEHFKSQHTVDDFIKVWNGRKSSPPGFAQFQVQFGRTSKECTLQQIDAMTICVHFSLQPSAVLLNGISCEPLTITWLVPPFIVPQLREDMENTSPKNFQLIGDYGIVDIKLDGDHVYNSRLASSLLENASDQAKVLMYSFIR